MATIAAFIVGGLMCAVLVACIGYLLRETVDQDNLVQGIFTLSVGAAATLLTILAFPESGIAIAMAYSLGCAATMAGFVVSGVARREIRADAAVGLRPHTFFRDPKSTFH